MALKTESKQLKEYLKNRFSNDFFNKNSFLNLFNIGLSGGFVLEPMC